jgi:predicted permease
VPVAVTGDIGFALRRLLRTPGPAGFLVCLLALVFALNASVFSVASGLLWAPLPYASQDRLVEITLHSDQMGMQLGWSRPYFKRVQDGTARLARVAAYATRDATLQDASGRGIASVESIVAQPGLFAILGHGALQGRTLQALDARAGAEPVAVIGEALWRSRFGADGSVVGRSVDIDGTRRRIVGVMPADFAFPLRTTQLWLPLEIKPEDLADGKIGSFGGTHAIGVLAAGADRDAASGELDALIRSTPPLRGIADSIGLHASVQPLRDLWLEDRAPSLLSLLGAAALVFVVTLLNAYTLFLLRVLRRRKEFAILESVGASPRQAHAQVAVEAVAIAFAAAAVAACLMPPALALLRKLDVMPTGVPVAIGLNGWSLAALAAMAMVSMGVLASAMGAIDGRNLYDNLRQSSHGQTASGGTHRVRRALLVGQVALTFVLLFGTALLVRNSHNLLSEDLGFARDGRVVGALRVDSDDAEPDSAVQARALSWLRAVQAVHGVEAAALATAVPLSDTVILEGFRAPAGASASSTSPPRAYQYYVGARYFDALGLAFARGRGFTATETASGAPVAVIDEDLAAGEFGANDPIGMTVTTADSRAGGFVKAQVVGVVRRTRQRALETRDTYPSIYLPDETPIAREGLPGSRVEFVAKTSDAALLESSIEAAAVPRVRARWTATLHDRVEETIADQLRLNLLLEILSGFAILLGGAGLYALLANAVQARRREFGIRLALGASPHDIRMGVLRDGMRLVVYGLAVGLPFALWLGVRLQPRLHAMTGHDPLAFAASVGIIVAIGLLANAIPARRASLSDPSEVLRSE